MSRLVQLAKVLEVPPGLLELDRPLPAEVFGRLGGGRGHRTFTGTPEQVADTIQDWFDRVPPTAST